ncbi:SMC-Scp complex subunit ScpB [Candidatus Kuenenbacteria bacterium CG23_combo_of_CG06-09_8_20_14_all_36_9]|uniref:SMC-Scp complex subunit ScpB n=1 Tax=Candidatus Kuenenbacteria bacterium CG10_big_fil_rev_8_21_14_0_10_36_11 TaxID=1974618 RepID=A0A2M6WB99_9BACT|nr:MAG: SMC-Scp complex subunit ScpB [Candidatus Kuenenbacteria bacterium CG23_combo_of_CG06-09_8_20_14_all_36_9]PIT90080.1 MAG: SMC-Scp complex subunit ScpB [Candidatus Kuenenbacteria bacterium CG10_big_fil_rev_8_21_14_0_10_36_11]
MIRKQIESLLFLSNRPLSIKKLAELTERSKTEIETVLETLKKEYNESERGIKIIFNDDRVQMTTTQESSAVVEKFLKEELTGEMTRPQLEALTIIAYRGPITKMELEQIRGVNCSLILRNLAMRGLIESKLDRKIGANVYEVTLDFTRYLGLTNTKELPDYERLSKHETIEEMLNCSS